MSQITRSWWGKRFLEALETSMDETRLKKGKQYTRSRILSFQLNENQIKATVRGNANPYFGVYTEPTYKTNVQMLHLSAAQWQKIIARLTQRASFIAKLLVDEIPENIEDVFADFTDRKSAAETQLCLQHGEPMLFGADKEKGIHFNPDTFSLEVIDIAGKLITRKDRVSGLRLIDLHGEKGIFILRMYSGTKVSTLKIGMY